MKYAVRIVRETETNRVTVYPVIPVTCHAKSFKRTGEGYSEALQVYETKEDALEAVQNEKVVSKCIEMPPEERLRLLNEEINRLKPFTHVHTLYRQGIISANTLRAYRQRLASVNSRNLARVIIFRERMETFMDECRRILPKK